MANLSDENLTKVFNLQRRIWQLLNEVTTTDWTIWEQYGETELTLSALEQLQNSRERLVSSYSRLHTLMVQIAEAQPVANSAILNLLATTIDQSESIVAAVEASVREAKQDFNLS